MKSNIIYVSSSTANTMKTEQKPISLLSAYSRHWIDLYPVIHIDSDSTKSYLPILFLVTEIK